MCLYSWCVQVISRTGDVCVVAFLDQWYLKYGEEEWRGIVERHINSDVFKSFNKTVHCDLNRAVGWLKEWACSRSFGLGTQLPWDKQFVIESLSDSTIYMSYYTIAHKLQSSVSGSGVGPSGITVEQLTDEVWEYIFKDGAYPGASCGIAEDTLADLRASFRYWYPLDLRVSGKDLIFNHLTMALYNHAAVWDGRVDRMPQGFFCNGHVLVDGQKMSKSLGNFLTLTGGCLASRHHHHHCHHHRSFVRHSLTWVLFAVAQSASTSGLRMRRESPWRTRATRWRTRTLSARRPTMRCCG